MRAYACRCSWSFGKLAVLEDQKRRRPAESVELFGRGVEALIGQLEGSVVNGDAGFGAQDFMRANGFIGSHVHRRHEPARLIRSDGQKGEIGRSELLANLSEVRPEGGVSGEV